MSANVQLDEVLEKVKEAISKHSKSSSCTEEKNQFKCPHSFGYLSKMPKENPLPEECFFCPEIVECLAPS